MNRASYRCKTPRPARRILRDEARGRAVELLGLVGIPPEQSFTLSIMVLVLSLVGTLPGGWFYLQSGVAPGRR